MDRSTYPVNTQIINPTYHTKCGVCVLYVVISYVDGVFVCCSVVIVHASAICAYGTCCTMYFLKWVTVKCDLCTSHVGQVLTHTFDDGDS